LLAAAAARGWGGRGAIRAPPAPAQIFRRDPLVVLDGAHNPAGARALAASLRAYFPGRLVTFVIGVLADKDAGGILAALRPLAARVILTASANPRAATPEALRTLLPAARVDTARSPRTPSRWPSRRIHSDRCVAGSLSLIGDVLAAADDGQDVLFTAGARC
jgi:dihydrofolate synthase/folylpolyglutamate synthase